MKYNKPVLGLTQRIKHLKVFSCAIILSLMLGLSACAPTVSTQANDNASSTSDDPVSCWKSCSKARQNCERFCDSDEDPGRCKSICAAIYDRCLEECGGK